MTTRIFAFVTVAVFLPGVAIAQEEAPRKLRILLVADGPMREFQFVRNALLRENKKNGGELSVYLQSKDPAAKVEDVEGLQVLRELPDRAGAADGGKKGPSLSDYDVIIAFDPDWAKLSAKQRDALKDWVGKHAGGIVFVAGAANTYQLARPPGVKLDAIKELMPVVVKDHRLFELDPIKTGPHAVAFLPNATLKLDAKGEGPAAGWNSFFWNDEKFEPEPGKEAKPKRGFFFSYPVQRLKASATVLATFDGPKDFRMADDKPQPFLVSMSFANGKTLFLGSAETWRLRAYNDAYFPTLWMALAHHVAAKRENANEK